MKEYYYPFLTRDIPVPIQSYYGDLKPPIPNDIKNKINYEVDKLIGLDYNSSVANYLKFHIWR